MTAYSGYGDNVVDGFSKTIDSLRSTTKFSLSYSDTGGKVVLCSRCNISELTQSIIYCADNV